MTSLAQDVEKTSRRPIRVRLWFLFVVLGAAAFVGWLAWPSSRDVSAIELSRADGQPRFEVTGYPKADLSGLTFVERLHVTWWNYRRRHTKPNPAAAIFPASPVQPCLIQGFLNQCMETTGTKYFVAVEVLGGGGTVDFGQTNSLNGAQWVSAFERALTNQPIHCYDYANKCGFNDTLLLIRERPDLVKVVPRSKLSVYEKAGLVKAQNVEDAGK